MQLNSTVMWRNMTTDLKVAFNSVASNSKVASKNERMRFYAIWCLDIV